ncbi:MAG: GntR family transcriptional regulator [Burkholderiales bacterium]|nr:GntR family transcriptional regulator [Burkholderiales bacterium]
MEKPTALPSNTSIAVSSPSSAPSFRPLYDQIKILLTQSLIAGEWKPGEAIPSETDLAGRYGVSQGTVRKAIDQLSAENILIRRQGKGTFVATHTAPQHQYRFLRIFANNGEKHHPSTRFIDVRKSKATTAAARLLDIKVGTPVITLRRVLVFAGRPLILDEVVVSAARFPNLTLDMAEASKGSLYSFFETHYGVRMIRAEERISAVAADGFAATQLNVAEGTPLLAIDRIAFTYGDKPVEWRRGLVHTDGYAYFNELA